MLEVIQKIRLRQSYQISNSQNGYQGISPTAYKKNAKAEKDILPFVAQY